MGVTVNTPFSVAAFDECAPVRVVVQQNRGGLELQQHGLAGVLIEHPQFHFFLGIECDRPVAEIYRHDREVLELRHVCGAQRVSHLGR
ncbi:hypothetical protein D3C85_1573080 [compost metagenome]